MSIEEQILRAAERVHRMAAPKAKHYLIDAGSVYFYDKSGHLVMVMPEKLYESLTSSLTQKSSD